MNARSLKKDLNRWQLVFGVTIEKLNATSWNSRFTKNGHLNGISNERNVQNIGAYYLFPVPLFCTKSCFLLIRAEFIEKMFFNITRLQMKEFISLE